MDTHITLNNKRHLLEPTDEKFWLHLDRHKAPIIPIPDQQKLRRGKIKTDKQLPGLSWTRENTLWVRNASVAENLNFSVNPKKRSEF